MTRTRESRFISGTMRWVSPTEWATICDDGHEPTGIARVERRADRVRVHYDFTASKVGSLQVTPDEQFASASVRVGASVGLSYADVFFYMSGTAPVDPALLTKKSANVWLTGHFLVECEVNDYEI